VRKIDARIARDILASAHEAWSNGALERMLGHYVDNLTYWCNVGAIDGQPFTIEGKQGLRTLLRSVLAVTESATSIETFRFEAGVADASIAAHVRHRRTGHEMSGVYRQVVTFRGRKILRCDEHHDAERMSAFWRMVTIEGGEAGDGQDA